MDLQSKCQWAFYKIRKSGSKVSMEEQRAKNYTSEEKE